jgi:hypothetical protein
MTCPRCGGTTYQLVADGVAECHSIIEMLSGAHPSGVAGPARLGGLCGYQYQVPTSSAQPTFCECGMQAIARCTECGKALCLTCSVRFEGRVLCREDYQTTSSTRFQLAERDLTDAWQALVSALDRVRTRGFAVANDCTGKHKIWPSDWEGVTGIDHRKSHSTRMRSLRAGGDCPLHTVGTCTVVGLEKASLFAAPQNARCEMPLWSVLKMPANLRVSRAGELIWEHDRELIAQVNPGPAMFASAVRPPITVEDLIREFTEKVVRLTA